MNQPWFRFYHEALDDPKVQKLPPEIFKYWVNMLCLASRTNGFLPDISDISFAFRCSISEVNSIITLLERAGLLDRTQGGRYMPHNWENRQFKSDSSVERTRRWRHRHRDVTVTSHVTDQNRAEQSRTDKEGNPPIVPLSGGETQKSVDTILEIRANRKKTIELLADARATTQEVMASMSEMQEDNKKRRQRMRQPVTVAPLSMEITEDMTKWARQTLAKYEQLKGTPVDLVAETAQMLDTHRAKGNLHSDWIATWRTWIRNIPKYGGHRGYIGTRKERESRGEMLIRKQREQDARLDQILLKPTGNGSGSNDNGRKDRSVHPRLIGTD